MDSITIPVPNCFFGSRTSWIVYVMVKEHVENSYSGNISSYGRITVKKKWITDDSNHGPARIVLTYTQDGQQRSATRTIDVYKRQVRIPGGAGGFGHDTGHRH